MHNIAAIASGIARSGADGIVIDGFRGGTGAASTRIRDNAGIPIELALASVDQRLRDEGIRNEVSLIVSGSIRSSADVIKAVALGADACGVATAPLLALGCHLCRACRTGVCNWGIATQDPSLERRLNPDRGAQRLVNLMRAWQREIMEFMGAMGINSIEALRGNRLMLRGVGSPTASSPYSACPMRGIAGFRRALAKSASRAAGRFVCRGVGRRRYHREGSEP
ncbi:MAG: glutamate synthase-related protein [Slackia sp.]